MITKIIKMRRFVSVGVSMFGNASKKGIPGQKIMKDKPLGKVGGIVLGGAI